MHLRVSFIVVVIYSINPETYRHKLEVDTHRLIFQPFKLLRYCLKQDFLTQPLYRDKPRIKLFNTYDSIVQTRFTLNTPTVRGEKGKCKVFAQRIDADSAYIP